MDNIFYSDIFRAVRTFKIGDKVNAIDRVKSIVFFKVRPNLSHLSNKEWQSLRFAINAAKIIDFVYRDQIFPHSENLYNHLKWNTDPESEAQVKCFEVMGCPWDLFDHERPFIEGVGEKLPGGYFYPRDLTQEEFEAYIAENPTERENLTSEYTVIVRDGKRLMSAPYSIMYGHELKLASDWLRNAAYMLDAGALKNFLELQAEAFHSNNYFESNLAWVDTDGTPYEIVIGPHETYEDKLFGYKSTFEATIGIRNEEATAELQKFLPLVPEVDAVLAKVYGYKPSASKIPLIVIDDVYRAGECAYGRQYTALNLPNDRRIHKLKGSKKLISKTMIEKKTELGQKIAERILGSTDLVYYNVRGRLLFVLFHELAHGIGPGMRSVNGEEISFEHILKEYHSPFEEAKADTLGLKLMQRAYSDNLVTPTEMKSAVVTELVMTIAGFRASLSEAHSVGSLIEYNWLKNEGAIDYLSGSKTFYINTQKYFSAMVSLADEFLKIQSSGSHADAREFTQRWGKVPNELPGIIERLKDLPIEVHAVFDLYENRS